MLTLCLSFGGPTKQFDIPMSYVQGEYLSNPHKHLFSFCSPPLFFFFFYYSCLDVCEVVCHCDFDLHFPSD